MFGFTRNSMEQMCHIFLWQTPVRYFAFVKNENIIERTLDFSQKSIVRQRHVYICVFIMNIDNDFTKIETWVRV